MGLEIMDIFNKLGNQLTKNTDKPGDNSPLNLLSGAFLNLTNSKSSDSMFSKITGGIATAGIAYGIDKTLGSTGNMAYLGLKSMGCPHMNKIALGGMAVGEICKAFGMSHETSQTIGTLAIVAGGILAGHRENKIQDPNKTAGFAEIMNTQNPLLNAIPLVGLTTAGYSYFTQNKEGQEQQTLGFTAQQSQQPGFNTQQEKPEPSKSPEQGKTFGDSITGGLKNAGMGIFEKNFVNPLG